jgi:hypothetical protein
MYFLRLGIWSNPPLSIIAEHPCHSSQLSPFPTPFLSPISKFHIVQLTAAFFLMQRTTWLHCAEPSAAANAAAAALALFDRAFLSGQADGVDEEHGSQIIKLLLGTGGTNVSSGEHIVDQLCSRIATSSAAVTAMYNDPPSSPELPYWSACASICQWFVRTVIQCHLCPLPAAACPSPPFLLPTFPAAHINMPACVKVSLLSFIQNCNSLCLPHRNPHPSAAMQALVAHVIAVARGRSQSCTSTP